jgi:hypothetical protein
MGGQRRTPHGRWPMLDQGKINFILAHRMVEVISHEGGFMKTIQRSASFLILVAFCCITSAYAQPMRTTVDEIIGNPGKFIDNVVDMEALVIQYVPATSSTTSYYLLKGNYGGIIKVNTSERPPEINRKYHVTGIVYVDPVTREPFISEKSKSLVEESENLAIIYLIIALIVVLVSVLIYLQIRKKKVPVVEEPSFSPPAPESEFKTVKLTVGAPKTMKFIPGQLVIVSGEDKGKSFRIAGYPTPEGSIVSIGRDTVHGDRAYAHIQLDNKFQTVSRRQAELIYIDNRLYARNLSETNPTQVDGIEIRPGEKTDVKPGSVIRMGELEFQYKI